MTVRTTRRIALAFIGALVPIGIHSDLVRLTGNRDTLWFAGSNRLEIKAQLSDSTGVGIDGPVAPAGRRIVIATRQTEAPRARSAGRDIAILSGRRTSLSVTALACSSMLNCNPGFERSAGRRPGDVVTPTHEARVLKAGQADLQLGATGLGSADIPVSALRVRGAGTRVIAAVLVGIDRFADQAREIGITAGSGLGYPNGRFAHRVVGLTVTPTNRFGSGQA